MNIWSALSLFFLRLEIARLRRQNRFCEKYELRYVAKQIKDDTRFLERAEANITLARVKL